MASTIQSSPAPETKRTSTTAVPSTAFDGNSSTITLHPDPVIAARSQLKLNITLPVNGFGKISLVDSVPVEDDSIMMNGGEVFSSSPPSTSLPASPEPETVSSPLQPESQASSNEWTTEMLDSLRLCRNRAYAKVNSKRRQHLPASLAAFLLKEWNLLHPKSSFKARELMQVYSKNFERAHYRKRKRPYKTGNNEEKSTETETTKRVKSDPPNEDHSNKQWSESMLHNLAAVGEIANLQIKDNPDLDFSSSLKEEWQKIYPNSTLTGRNLKSRLFLYQKTRVEFRHANKRQIVSNTGIKTQRESPEHKDLTEGNAKRNCENENNKNESHPPVNGNHFNSDVEDKDDDYDDEEDQDDNDRGSDANNKEDDKTEMLEDVKNKLLNEIPHTPNGERACPEHWIHLFFDADKNVECSLTEQLLKIRQSLETMFPNCDIYKPKKPKGFAAALLEEWKRHYPKSQENNKSICFKLSKYDRKDGLAIDEGKIKLTPKGRVIWSQTMLNNLQHSRKIAEAKAQEFTYKTPTAQAITRIWKKEWKNMYPDLKMDWRTVISRYNYHFAGLDSTRPDFEVEDNKKRDNLSSGVISSQNSGEDSEVKGFRSWNTVMKQGLVDTKYKIIQSLQTNQEVDVESKQFAKLLFEEFRKIFPKCMESTRSLLSRLQSIEKEGFVSKLEPNVKIDLTFENKEKPQTTTFDEVELKHEQNSEIENVKKTEIINEPKIEPVHSPPLSIPPVDVDHESLPTLSDDAEPPTKEIQVVKREDFNEELSPKKETLTKIINSKKVKAKTDLSAIEGFRDWSLSMIRDFIGCMDIARRKYAALKDQKSSQPPRLIPLLLNEWKEIYPNSKETVKTFLEKIKHLKLQKEVIKKHLGQSGLLPKRESSSSESKEEAKIPVTISTAAITTNSTTVSTTTPSIVEVTTATTNSTSSSIISTTAITTTTSTTTTTITTTTTTNKSTTSPFQWNRSMMGDVVETRQIALEKYAKEKEECKPGRKASFHNLWAAEFKKIYPNSTFTSNNLSAHFWMWRKSQGKKSSQETSTKAKPELNSNNINNSINKRSGVSTGHLNSASWPTEDRIKLLEVGSRVQEILQNPNTPNEIKLAGFVNVLFDEWKKERPNRKEDTVRGLNMLYSKLLKDGVKDDLDGDVHCEKDLKSVSKWTPKHNRVLRKCVAATTDSNNTPSIIKEWRKSFPLSTACDSDIANRITDLMLEQEQTHQNKDSTSSTDSPTKKFWMAPETRKYMNRCYTTAKTCQSTSADKSSLANSFYKEFTKKYPNCTLSPTLLLAKFYKWNDVPSVSTQTQQLTSPKSEISTSKTIKQNGVKELVLRTWTQEMLKNMIESRKIAVQKRKKSSNPEMNNLSEMWFQEFLKFHPEYKSTKRNLLRKYKWYKSRTNNATTPESFPSQSQTRRERDPEVIKMKNIKKDLLQHIKALMEEPRIFLPYKVPPIKDLMENPKVVVPPPLYGNNGLPQIVPTPSKFINNNDEGDNVYEGDFYDENKEDHSDCNEENPGQSIKLPGGATLVAVTDKNSDLLLKPKAMEKPHVTITIGERSELNADHTSQSISFPIQMPTITNDPTQEPLKLKVPYQVRSRLIELGLMVQDLQKLLEIYEQARKEYVRALKKGYLSFFPHVLQVRWIEHFAKSTLSGRKLSSLVELFLEEHHRGQILSPEYLTKIPCKFLVTELTLKQILVCFTEVRRIFGNECSDSKINVEAHKRWLSLHPEVKLSLKQIISIHCILLSETKPKDLRDLEIEFSMADVYKSFSTKPDTCGMEEEKEEEKLKPVSYDPETVSVDQLQEWFLQTRNIFSTIATTTNSLSSSSSSKSRSRPRYSMKNLRLFWSLKKMEDLNRCYDLADRKFKKWNRSRFGEFSFKNTIHKEWVKSYPKSALNSNVVLAKYISHLKRSKHLRTLEENREIREWSRFVKEFADNEEEICVTVHGDHNNPDEAACDSKPASKETDVTLKNRRSAASSINSNQNTNAKTKTNAKGNTTFTSEEDIYRHIDEANVGKKNVIWSSAVMRDLMKARQEARRRKKEWEKIAIEKYGGVGVAYANPQIKIEKVDDLFQEEWIKLRPKLAHLSIWTLSSYARKFDHFKKQLLVNGSNNENHNQSLVSSSSMSSVANSNGNSVIKYFPSSSIPVYDLEAIETLEEVSREVKDLLLTRQLAKQRQNSPDSIDSKMTLSHLWSLEWQKIHPDNKQTGHQLMTKIWSVERSRSNLNRLKRALCRKQEDENSIYSEVPCSDGDGLVIIPRRYVFPEDEFLCETMQQRNALHHRVSIMTKEKGTVHNNSTLIHVRAESLMANPKKSFIEIPEIYVEKETCNDRDLDTGEYDFIKIQAKVKRQKVSFDENDYLSTSNRYDLFLCEKCEKKFHNVNNFKHHMGLHLEQE